MENPIGSLEPTATEVSTATEELVVTKKRKRQRNQKILVIGHKSDTSQPAGKVVEEQRELLCDW